MRLLSLRTDSRLAIIVALILVASATIASGQTPAPTGTFTPGTREIFNLDLSSTPAGSLPKTLKPIDPKSKLAVAMKDGVPMLKAIEPSEFRIDLGETLPETFTLEFDVTPKACCNPEDLSFEGARIGTRSAVSAHVVWDADQLLVVGGGEYFQMGMPAELAATLPAALTKVAVSYEAGTLSMFTNGKMLYSLKDRKFARGRMLYVFLGGQDSEDHAVYLSRLRVAAGGGMVATNTGTSTSSSNSGSSSTSAPPAPTNTTSSGSTTTSTSGTSTATTGTTTATPVTGVLTTPPMTTATGMLSSPPVITGPEYTSAIFAFSSYYPAGVLVGWKIVPNATAYRIYRMPSATAPGELRGTVTNPRADGDGMTIAVDPDASGSDVKNYRYWVQAVFTDGKVSDPGPIAAVKIDAPEFLLVSGPGPTGLTASIGGTTMVFPPGGQETRGNKVAWTWDTSALPVAATLFYATIETGLNSGFGIAWTLLRSEKIKGPATSPFPYITPMPAVSGPPYVMSLAAGTQVRFCISYLPIRDEQRQNNVGCVTSQLPP